MSNLIERISLACEIRLVPSVQTEAGKIGCYKISNLELKDPMCVRPKHYSKDIEVSSFVCSPS